MANTSKWTEEICNIILDSLETTKEYHSGFQLAQKRLLEELKISIPVAELKQTYSSRTSKLSSIRKKRGLVKIAGYKAKGVKWSNPFWNEERCLFVLAIISEYPFNLRVGFEKAAEALGKKEGKNIEAEALQRCYYRADCRLRQFRDSLKHLSTNSPIKGLMNGKVVARKYNDNGELVLPEGYEEKLTNKPIQWVSSMTVNWIVK